MGENGFARTDVVQEEVVAFLGALQGALCSKEVAGGVNGLVITAYLLKLTNRG